MNIITPTRRPKPKAVPGHWTICESPIGPLTLFGGPSSLRAIHFPGRAGVLEEGSRDDAALAGAVAQLQEYFAGTRQRFELALDLRGTQFQQSVWSELLAIPFGATTTYGTIADRLGRRDRVRAVGAAVGRTPVPIIVPCHRVLGAGGELTGYGGGLQRKQALLDLESAVSGGEPAPGVWAGRQLPLL
ncbi:MAG: methylated-DNA--[protein]-cysteine S-methyltransferase [Solirubrobacteraceae bacterium]